MEIGAGRRCASRNGKFYMDWDGRTETMWNDLMRAVDAAAPQPPALGGDIETLASVNSRGELVRKGVLRSVDLVDRAHVFRLQAEVERLNTFCEDAAQYYLKEKKAAQFRIAELEGLLLDLRPTVQAVADDEGLTDFKQADILLVRTDAALASGKCCQPTAAETAALQAGDCTPEELWGGSRPTCPKCHDSKALADGGELVVHPHPDTARLDFMLLCCRKVTVEVGPGEHEIYVEEGFMSDKRYPSLAVAGEFDSKSAAVAKAKRHAIDLAMAEGKEHE